MYNQEIVNAVEASKAVVRFNSLKARRETVYASISAMMHTPDLPAEQQGLMLLAYLSRTTLDCIFNDTTSVLQTVCILHGFAFGDEMDSLSRSELTALRACLIDTYSTRIHVSSELVQPAVMSHLNECFSTLETALARTESLTRQAND